MTESSQSDPSQSPQLLEKIALLSTDEQRFLCTCLLRLQACPPGLAAELPGFAGNLPALCAMLYRRYAGDPEASAAGARQLEPEQALQLVQLFGRLLGGSRQDSAFNLQEFLDQNADLAADFPLMNDEEKARLLGERLRSDSADDPGFSPDPQKKS